MIRSFQYKAIRIANLAFRSAAFAWIALAMGGSQSAYAVKNNCADQIKEALITLHPDTAGTLITSQEREQIEAIFNDPEKRPSAAKRVFELLMAKRLALLPPEDAAQIKKIIESAESAKVVNASKVEGRYLQTFRTLIISLPETYHGSIVEFFIKTHEIEHAIQGLAAARKLGKKSVGYFQNLLNGFDAQIKFLEEAGAMQAEWQYLQAIPAQVKQKIADDIAQNPQIKEHEKNFLIRVLEGDPWTASDHTEIEWMAGRYTMGEIENEIQLKKMTYANRARAARTAATIGAFGAISTSDITSVAILEHYCEDLIKNSPTPPSGAFYQNVCTKLSSAKTDH